jgi:hypothetical protein
MGNSVQEKSMSQRNMDKASHGTGTVSMGICMAVTGEAEGGRA